MEHFAMWRNACRYWPKWVLTSFIYRRFIRSALHTGKARTTPLSQAGDVGSPWGIGGEAGGHKAIHPELGTLDDFRGLTRVARRNLEWKFRWISRFSARPIIPT